MSGDHNMNQTDSGWRKRQIALNKKADNARELGLDYESDKTVMDMARESGGMFSELPLMDAWVFSEKSLEAFAKLVRADEREACAKVCEKHGYDHYCGNVTDKIAETIRARGEQA